MVIESNTLNNISSSNIFNGKKIAIDINKFSQKQILQNHIKSNGGVVALSLSKQV